MLVVVVFWVWEGLVGLTFDWMIAEDVVCCFDCLFEDPVDPVA